MKLKKALLSGLLLMGVLSASAQDQQPKTEYVHNPYWYVQLQAGGQYTLGEIDFSDLLSPNVQVAIGRQFTPVVGARFAVNAWQSRAGIDFNDGQTAKWKWMYVAPGVDATFNLSNLFCGYNPKRIFNFSVLGGLGANIAWDMDKESNWTNYPAIAAHYTQTLQNGKLPENIQYVWNGTKVRLYGRVGAAADFRISDAVSLGLEVTANTLSDRYNGKKAGNADWYFNALVGAKINLGKTHSTRTVEAPKPVERVVEKVIERVVEKPCKCPEKCEKAPEVKKVVEEKVGPLRRDVFFTISSVAVHNDEQQKVKDVADYLKANPNATVEVTGYADKGTGNSKLNMSLSQRRAQVVRDLLVNTYGIKASRIKTDAKGDTVQPFAKDVDNRVSICIAQ